MICRLNPAIADWSGRRVWIVGASSGIGAALAEALLEAGAHVAISARRLDALEQVVAGGMASGEFDPEMSADEAAGVLLALMWGAATLPLKHLAS